MSVRAQELEVVRLEGGIAEADTLLVGMPLGVTEIGVESRV